MKKLKKVAASVLAICMLAGTVYAETNAATYKATVTNSEIAVEEKDLKSGIDNSNLEVNVIKQQGDTRTTIFTGKLKDYDNGAWVNTDFSEIQFMLIFDWNTMDNESVCIIPVSSKSNTINETADTLSSNTESTDGSPSSNSNAGLTSDIKVLYDNEYYEGAFIANGSLDTEINVENAGNAKNLVCYLAEYDQNGKLIDLTSNSSISVPANGNITAHLTKTFSDPNTAVAKIFLWEQNSLSPITNSISLQPQQTDYYADSFSEAKKYNITKAINGRINSISDIDYIKFIPAESGKYVISANSDANLTGTLYNAQNEIMTSGVSESGSYYVAETLEAGNTYYLKTSGNAVGDYRIVVTKMSTDGLVEITGNSIKLTQSYNSDSTAVVKLYSSGNLLKSVTATNSNNKISAAFSTESLQPAYTITVSSNGVITAVYEIKTVINSNTYNVTNKSYVSVPVVVSNVANLNGIYFSVAFNESEFNIADVCEHTYTVSETGTGIISNAEVNIRSIENNAVIFTSTKELTDTWSGNINTVKLQAIDDGEFTINSIVYAVR